MALNTLFMGICKKLVLAARERENSLNIINNFYLTFGCWVIICLKQP
jgi:hypothetical protein